MFERFSEQARMVIVLAGEEARILKHAYLGTEHVLLALLREEDGLALRVLESFDVTLEKARAHIVRIMGTGEVIPGEGQIPFTPHALRLMEVADREARSLGDDVIDTEHLLLGLLKAESVGARVLADLGATADAIRERVATAMSERDAQPRAVHVQPVQPRRSAEVERLLDMAAREAATDGSPEVRLRHVVRAVAEFFGR